MDHKESSQFFTPKPANSIEQFWDNQALLPGYQGVVVDTENNLSTQMLYNFLTTQLNFKDEIVVDIGCGVGRLFPVYINFGAKEIHGIDISMNMVRVARFKYPQENVYLYKLTADDMAVISSEKASLVIACTTLCHIIDDTLFYNTIKEIVRICASNGIIFICDPMSITADITHEHSMMKTRSVSLYQHVFDNHCRTLTQIHYSRECFGQVDHIDSARSVLVYRKL
jgi:ubiquinone/menaquinone biosynthesis C-methylase UbiE